MVNRQRLLYELHERDYLRTLHRSVKEGLIGTLCQEYLLAKPHEKTYEQNNKDSNQLTSLPVFHAVVDMMTANLLYSTSEKFVHEICDVLDKMNKEENPNVQPKD